MPAGEPGQLHLKCYATHTPNQMSHDAINPYLSEDRLTSRPVWEHVRAQIQIFPHGYVEFDDTAPGKNILRKIEQFHCESKQTAGIAKNQSRTARIQRNHTACTRPVWIRLTDLARKTGQTIYRMKHGLLDDYLSQQFKNSSVKMRFS